MLTIGVTGSIGMGKSTTARLFQEAGIAVCDSDAVVHSLYQEEAVGPIGSAFPEVIRDGAVDRAALSKRLADKPADFAILEAIVHPLVRQKQDEFLKEQKRAGATLAVLDIPLLFETKAQDRVDFVVVVSADPQIQRQRVLARPGMSEEKFELIMKRQMPDEEKRKRADFIIDTGRGIEPARRDVLALIEKLKSGNASRS
ncbi:dephospho-CoA kinase [Oryzifoliimicrobium ureilyticus]|uniref:dephospho-CoA kinase n=1 Tax=Oryzifoliimicrobium ureilyticus TaxID=3113724 RepID=UPI0030762AFC